MTSKRALYVSVGLIVLYWIGFAASRLLRPHHPAHGVTSIALNGVFSALLGQGQGAPTSFLGRSS